MMTGLYSDDHAACDSASVERGIRFLSETPRHIGGAAIPALRHHGLSPKQASEAQHNLAMWRAG
ncbi:hypothetical protein NKH34_29740 [Mesorhizobium sp. M1148]|uniref:hypothetical protein n=1 Tax=unclassified Mesorhizobium TaxID=325217 RepID=UPI0003CE612B|nr:MULTISPECIES: hypothetical protein [unclassified Mesorhizobium]ESY20202.1 hypothetical protein X751_10835 [Mesorhizobium sp. LNJC395A00]WJI76990.1 hypothetical protein NLY37_09960 [Mesorhizobium sp. C395A]